MIPYNLLNACDYNELYKNTKIFSIDQLESDLVIKLPKNCADLMIYELINISKSDTQEDVFIGEIKREPGRLWLDVKLHLLDLTSGKHMYKLKFTNEENTKHFVVFFAYIIQDDNPLTPYTYMKGRGNNPKVDPKPDPIKPVPKPIDYEIVSSEPFLHVDENEEASFYLTSLKDNQEFKEMYTYKVSSPYLVQVRIVGRYVYVKGIRHGNCGITFKGDFSQKTLKVNVEIHPVDYTMTTSTNRLAVRVGMTDSFIVRSTAKGQPLNQDYELDNSNPDCFYCVNNNGIIAVTGTKVGTGVITVTGKITGQNYSKDVNIVVDPTQQAEIVTDVDGIMASVGELREVTISTQRDNEVIPESYRLEYTEGNIICGVDTQKLYIVGQKACSGEIIITGETSHAVKTFEYIITS